MFEIEIDSDFSAAHHLRDYPGDCAKQHGHNWSVTATVGVEKLDTLGIACDFRLLKHQLAKVIEQLDHKNLNDIPAFATANPTSEMLAMHIYNELKAALAETGVKVIKITLSESRSSRATYYES